MFGKKKEKRESTCNAKSKSSFLVNCYYNYCKCEWCYYYNNVASITNEARCEVIKLKNKIKECEESKIYTTKEWNDLRDENERLKAENEELNKKCIAYKCETDLFNLARNKTIENYKEICEENAQLKIFITPKTEALEKEKIQLAEIVLSLQNENAQLKAQLQAEQKPRVNNTNKWLCACCGSVSGVISVEFHCNDCTEKSIICDREIGEEKAKCESCGDAGCPDCTTERKPWKCIACEGELDGCYFCRGTGVSWRPK